MIIEAAGPYIPVVRLRMATTSEILGTLALEITVATEKNL